MNPAAIRLAIAAQLLADDDESGAAAVLALTDADLAELIDEPDPAAEPVTDQRRQA